MTTVIDRTMDAAGGQAVKPAKLPRPKPISVNGVTIPRAAIARETQNHPATKPVEAWMAAARALVVRELLLQEARRVGIAPSPLTDAEGRRETDEEALVRQLVDEEVKTPEPDEESCRRVFARNRARFRSADLFAVRHILLAAAPGDSEARRRARHEAEALLSKLQAAPDTFARLAQACSACPSAAQGGNLGQISRGQTVPEFEEALATLEGPGIVETRYGFHVVVVDQRLPGRDLPFEVVHARIAEWLNARARHAAIRQYISILAGSASITGIDLGVGQSPLVQ